MVPDGPKTCGSCGSGSKSPTLSGMLILSVVPLALIISYDQEAAVSCLAGLVGLRCEPSALPRGGSVIRKTIPSTASAPITGVTRRPHLMAAINDLLYMAPCVGNVFDACRSTTRASGRGVGPRKARDFGPCEMASSRPPPLQCGKVTLPHFSPITKLISNQEETVRYIKERSGT
jgi:hypothetical protein